MTLISRKISLVVPVLLAFLLITTTAASLISSTFIASYGTINYSSVFSKAYQKSELRGVLVKFIYWYEYDADLIAQTLASYGFNAVYLEVNPFVWTGYMLKDFQSMIDASKKYGLDFHVLFLYYGYDSGYTDAAEAPYPYGLKGSDPDWRMIDVDGNPVDWSCFQRASARARVKQVIETMLTFFPDIVDINHDYIRYPTEMTHRVCYCNECKAAFEQWLQVVGKAPIGEQWPGPFAYGAPRWKDFAEWRVNPINNRVRDVRQWALAKNPNLIFTADTWIPFPGWTPDLYKEELGADYPYWISQGWLDAINPMIYTNDLSYLTYAIDNIIEYQLGSSKGAIPLVPFISHGGPGVGYDAVSIDFWVQEIDTIRQKGGNGFIIWRYSGPGLSAGFTDITPYLAAIRDRSAKGAYPVFRQSGPFIAGSTITWQTSLPTIGKVEYSQTPIFTATPKTGSLLPYVEIDYVPGTILSESTPTQNHAITIPLSPPFYFRIRDEDSNVELASPVYLVTG